MAYNPRHKRALSLVAITGALGAGMLLGSHVIPVTAQDTAKMTAEQRASAASVQGAFINVADTVLPATVHITTRTAAARAPGRDNNPDNDGPDAFPFGDLPFPFRGMPQGPRQGRASGSGVIVRQDGYILTNDHVIANAEGGMVTVTLHDGRELRGKVTRDFRSDLAIVKVDAGKPLPFVRIADSDRVKPGQWAIAIGSPFGQQGTVTVGIVSALHRKSSIGFGTEGRYYPNLIQTDASINPGNSGGPLLNMEGELVGINVAIESPTGASAGIGFAIPSNTARRIMEQLITRGAVTRGYLGLAPEDVPAGLRERLGTSNGAYVTMVTPDTPAAAAGIRAGDVITRFNGREIRGEVELRDAIADTAPGAKVSITLLRNGQSRTVDATIGAPPSETGPRETPAEEPRPISKLGFAAQPLTREMVQELKLDAGQRGVVVGTITPGSAAGEAGLSSRDIITAVNGKAVATVDELNAAVGAAKSGDIVTFTVLRFAGDGAKPSEAVVNVTIP